MDGATVTEEFGVTYHKLEENSGGPYQAIEINTCKEVVTTSAKFQVTRFNSWVGAIIVVAVWIVGRR